MENSPKEKMPLYKKMMIALILLTGSFSLFYQDFFHVFFFVTGLSCFIQGIDLYKNQSRKYGLIQMLLGVIVFIIIAVKIR
ncbi:hypothetical protein [Bacillus massiliglaciei]|uniref:hypothetical protein n=1 Tax=Bacillus massiliglaciei TaxID=1816693 RepID=UPI000DA63630|nr:hypothetical protein [Bacillus massiliglaciei]